MENRAKIEKIRLDMAHGRITIEEAKEMAKPLIISMNVKANEIAKEHGKKHRSFTFGYLMR